MERATTSSSARHTTRRGFLKVALAITGASAATAILSACGSQSATATAVPATPLQPTTPAPTSAPVATTAVTATLAATSEATAEATMAAETATTATAGSSPTPAIFAAANAFLQTLDDTQRTGVSFAYPTDQTTATAANFGFRVGEQFGTAVWSNYPISDVIRPGLTMGDLTDAQRQAVMTLLASTLSGQGYQKVQNIMMSDQLLSEGGTNYASGADNYVIGIFGTPSESDRWMVQFGGHHLGINATIQGAAMTLAPMLTGCQPSSFTSEGQTVRPLGGETDKAFALINALDATQQSQAILSYSVSDLVLGPGHDGQVLQPEGISAASLNADQQAQLMSLAGEWINILNDTAAQMKMADIQTHLADTYFAWSGAITPESAVYFRITGPTVHIEFAHQGGGPGGGQGGGPGGGGPNGTQQTAEPSGAPAMQQTTEPSTVPADAQQTAGPGGGQQNPLETGGVNHIHTVYRDPTNEYGMGLT